MSGLTCDHISKKFFCSTSGHVNLVMRTCWTEAASSCWARHLVTYRRNLWEVKKKEENLHLNRKNHFWMSHWRMNDCWTCWNICPAEQQQTSFRFCHCCHCWKTSYLLHFCQTLAVVWLDHLLASFQESEQEHCAPHPGRGQNDIWDHRDRSQHCGRCGTNLSCIWGGGKLCVILDCREQTDICLRTCKCHSLDKDGTSQFYNDWHSGLLDRSLGTRGNGLMMNKSGSGFCWAGVYLILLSNLCLGWTKNLPERKLVTQGWNQMARTDIGCQSESSDFGNCLDRPTNIKLTKYKSKYKKV